MNKPLLGVDLGKSRTGLALSENGLIASPLTTLVHNTPHQSEIIAQLLEVIRKQDIRTAVVGIPLHQNDTPSEQALWCTQIMSLLETEAKNAGLNIEIISQNEYHSTKDALAVYPSADKDAAAAAVILQQYLDDHI